MWTVWQWLSDEAWMKSGVWSRSDAEAAHFYLSGLRGAETRSLLWARLNGLAGRSRAQSRSCWFADTRAAELMWSGSVRRHRGGGGLGGWGRKGSRVSCCCCCCCILCHVGCVPPSAACLLLSSPFSYPRVSRYQQWALCSSRDATLGLKQKKEKLHRRTGCLSGTAAFMVSEQKPSRTSGRAGWPFVPLLVGQNQRASAAGAWKRSGGGTSISDFT